MGIGEFLGYLRLKDLGTIYRIFFLIALFCCSIIPLPLSLAPSRATYIFVDNPSRSLNFLLLGFPSLSIFLFIFVSSSICIMHLNGII